MSITGMLAGLLYFTLLMSSLILLSIWADGDKFLGVFGGIVWVVSVFYWSWVFKKKGID